MCEYLLWLLNGKINTIYLKTKPSIIYFWYQLKMYFKSFYHSCATRYFLFGGVEGLAGRVSRLDYYFYCLMFVYFIFVFLRMICLSSLHIFLSSLPLPFDTSCSSQNCVCYMYFMKIHINRKLPWIIHSVTSRSWNTTIPFSC